MTAMRALVPLLGLLGGACATPGSSLTAHRDARPFRVALEGGAAWQSKNDVRIPGDTGTRFALDELIGAGPFALGRLTADWDLDARHAVRAVAAPLSFDGDGTLPRTTEFAGATFAPGVDTDGTYQFSSYRLGYRYTFLHEEHWRLRAGGTLFVRDAEIELRQGATRASDSDVGLVPLLNFSAEYTPSRTWLLAFELDGLGASQGRALDLSLMGYRELADGWELGLGYRTIEGGVDNDSVYNFAWLHAAVVTLAARF